MSEWYSDDGSEKVDEQVVVVAKLMLIKGDGGG